MPAIDPNASRISIHMAAMCGDVEVIRSILRKKGPPVDIEQRDMLGDSGLIKAARYGHLEVRAARLHMVGHCNCYCWSTLHERKEGQLDEPDILSQNFISAACTVGCRLLSHTPFI